jgi:hypothetical protein
LLINLVVDALAAMLDAAKKRGGGGDPGAGATFDKRRADTSAVCRQYCSHDSGFGGEHSKLEAITLLF